MTVTGQKVKIPNHIILPRNSAWVKYTRVDGVNVKSTPTEDEVTEWLRAEKTILFYIQDSFARSFRLVINFNFDGVSFLTFQILNELSSWGGSDKSVDYQEQGRGMRSWEFTAEMRPAIDRFLQHRKTKDNWIESDPKEVWY